MSLLVETIRSEDGILKNVVFHNERLLRSLYGIFGLKTIIDLEKIITVPEIAKKGLFKCRVEYDREIRNIEFLPYEFRQVKTLKLIENNTIDYTYKYVDRSAIEKLMSGRNGCDDILIIRNGYVTDSSFANLIFKDSSENWVTPSTYLLQGTRRTNLLRSGLISEARIRLQDLTDYSEVKLINAMIDIADSESIPVTNII
jgi:4-amino-4-deoxychorismate lyase